MQFLSEAASGHAFSKPNVKGQSCSRGRLQVLAAVRKKSLKNVVFSKTLVAKEKYLKKLMRECKSMADHGKKEMMKRENGILEFTVFQDQFDENQIHFFERYEDKVKMGKFNSGERFSAFMKTVQQYVDKPVGIVLYEWDNNTISTACVQGGPKGEACYLETKLRPTYCMLFPYSPLLAHFGGVICVFRLGIVVMYVQMHNV